MDVKTASFDAYEAKTPSSIASSPRAPFTEDSDRTCASLQQTAAQLEASTEAATPKPPPIAHILHDVWLGLRHTRRDTDGLHGVLQLIHAHVCELHQELVHLTTEMARQQQAADINLMEKDCEIRTAQSEAAAYSLAANTRAAAVAELQSTVAALEEDQQQTATALTTATSELHEKTLALQTSQQAVESSSQRIAELESTVAELDSSVEMLGEELKTSQSRVEEYERQAPEHAHVRSMMEAARADAVAAANQLVDACEENSQLAEVVGSLQMQLERKNTEIVGLQQQQLQRDSSQAMVKLKLSASNPASSFSRQVTDTTKDDDGDDGDNDDLLAMEISRLRGQNKHLEKQLATARDLTPIVAALERESALLRRENKDLQSAAHAAMSEAAQAKLDLHQVQTEARTLHGQLTDVIASLAGAGLDASPVTLPSLLTTAPEPPPHRIAAAASSASAGVPALEENSNNNSKEKVMKVMPPPPPTQAVVSIDKFADTATALQLNTTDESDVDQLFEDSQTSLNQFWRGGAPSTPTWTAAPPVGSTTRGGGVPTRPGSESGSDMMVVAELRSAIAHLEMPVGGVSLAEGSIEKERERDGGGSFFGGERSSESIEEDHQDDDDELSRRPFGSTSNTTTTAAADVLASISQGIAALGRHGAEFGYYS